MNIEIALQIALDAHQGQVDKANLPYILHPLRLMNKFKQTDLQIIALLHDVVEDSDFTIENLRQSGFSELILEVIECLTKRENENYDGFIERIRKNAFATQVKIADIKDNLDLSRLSGELTAKDVERILKYHKALKTLSQT